MTKIKFYNQKLNVKKIIQTENDILSDQGIIICDLSHVIRKFELWEFALPRIKPFFAVKCNDDPNILKLLNELGCGFDCASKTELIKVKSINVSSDNIIFAHPHKIKSHLKYAELSGIKKMTFDSEDELIKIKNSYPNAELLLRIRCDATKSLLPIGDKFGCDFEQNGAKLLQMARLLELNIIGICFHVGSGCEEYNVYERAIKASSELFKFGNKIGLNMNFLDIGGGFPGVSKTEFLQISKIINKSLAKYFPNENEIDVVAEPGRYFVESSQTLIAEIYSKREIEEKGRIQKVMYYLNDGVYGSLHLLLHQKKNLILEFYDTNDLDNVKRINLENQDLMKFDSTIWGPACNPIDCVIEGINLPQLSLGTKLVLRNRGAYGLTLSSGFNGFSIPLVKYFVNLRDKHYFEI